MGKCVKDHSLLNFIQQENPTDYYLVLLNSTPLAHIDILKDFFWAEYHIDPQ